MWRYPRKSRDWLTNASRLESSPAGEEFFNQAAHLLLARLNAEPIPVDAHWNARVDTLLEEADASGEATKMSEHDWHEIERQGLALIQRA